MALGTSANFASRRESSSGGRPTRISRLDEELLEFGVAADRRRGDDTGVVLGDEPLRQLRVREVPVPDQLVGARPRDAGDVEGRRRVLEQRRVADLEDMPQIPGVGRGARIGLVPALSSRRVPRTR